MVDPSFSERYGFAPQPEQKSHDYLPAWIREDIVYTIRVITDAMYFDSGIKLYQIVRPYVRQVLQRDPPQNPMGGPWAYYIPNTLMECTWWQFYEILEKIAQFVGTSQKESDEFTGSINASLAREGIPWKIENGKIVHAFNEQIQSRIDEVRVLLTKPIFKAFNSKIIKFNHIYRISIKIHIIKIIFNCIAF